MMNISRHTGVLFTIAGFCLSGLLAQHPWQSIQNVSVTAVAEQRNLSDQ